MPQHTSCPHYEIQWPIMICLPLVSPKVHHYVLPLTLESKYLINKYSFSGGVRSFTNSAVLSETMLINIYVYAPCVIWGDAVHINPLPVESMLVVIFSAIFCWALREIIVAKETICWCLTWTYLWTILIRSVCLVWDSFLNEV